MLEAMRDGGIALCDTGTGIGKTYAYLNKSFMRVEALLQDLRDCHR